MGSRRQRTDSRRFAACRAAALVTVALLLSSCGGDRKAASGQPDPRADVLWGVQVDPQGGDGSASSDLSALVRFERRVGHEASLLNWSLPWRWCGDGTCRWLGFPTEKMTRIRARGTIPAFGWASYQQPLTTEQPAFRLRDIAGGTYDSFIRSWARSAARWGHPFFLRFNWEMNVPGLWPYSTLANGNEPGDYVRAWRHVHDVMTAAGATNATWVWCPNIEFPGSTPLAGLYPGDAYVDWTCLDGYNWPAPRGDGRQSFRKLFAPSYDRLTRELAPGKPMMVGETATTGRTGIKAAWIDAMFRDLPRRFPKIRALMYFDKADDGADWPIEGDTAALAAFRRGIVSPRYAGATYAELSGAPIPPP